MKRCLLVLMIALLVTLFGAMAEAYAPWEGSRSSHPEDRLEQLSYQKQRGFEGFGTPVLIDDDDWDEDDDDWDDDIWDDDDWDDGDWYDWDYDDWDKAPSKLRSKAREMHKLRADLKQTLSHRPLDRSKAERLFSRILQLQNEMVEWRFKQRLNAIERRSL